MNETVEEIRIRLLHDEGVIFAIQQRAYEIWVLRGRQHGRAEEDWTLAENEVIGFLIEQELQQPTEMPLFPEGIVEVMEVAVVSTPLDITPEPIAEADLIIVAEPLVEVVVNAPEIVEEKKPKHGAPKSAAKATSEGKTKTGKDNAENKTAAKKTTTANQSTTKKASTKKSAKTEQPTAK